MAIIMVSCDSGGKRGATDEVPQVRCGGCDMGEHHQLGGDGGELGIQEMATENKP